MLFGVVVVEFHITTTTTTTQDVNVEENQLVRLPSQLSSWSSVQVIRCGFNKVRGEEW